MPFAFLDHPAPLAFAHRGGAGDGLENSAAAFATCVEELGYRYLETDVHATADGVAVAFHDRSLDRVTDRAGLIAALPWREVRRARIGGREPVCRLDDLLARWPDVRWNLDVKSAAAAGPLAAAVGRTGAADRICLASFSRQRLSAARRLLGPGVCSSLPSSGVARLRLDSWLRSPFGTTAGACVQVPVRIGRVPVCDRALLAAAHRRGLPVHVWTVDDPAEITALLELGVDGVMTDRPAVLREVLRARGQWPA